MRHQIAGSEGAAEGGEKSSIGPGKAPAVERYGFLNSKGGCITDQFGNPLILRGVSLFWSQWQPKYFNRDVLRWLRDDWFVDVVRAPLAVHHGGYLDRPQEEERKIETVISGAIDLGLYVVVDWHAHDPETDSAAAFFSRLSKNYGRYPNIIYETWNEPSDKYDWGGAIKHHHMNVCDAIRNHDDRNLIIAGTQNWSRDVDVAANDPLEVSNVAYALHFYAASHGKSLRRKVDLALKMDATIFASEWGASRADGGGDVDLAQAAVWLGFLEERGIGHINWSISDKVEAAAAMKPDAPVSGGWNSGHLTLSGQFVREYLRRFGAASKHAV